jgi:hypothetical protein
MVRAMSKAIWDDSSLGKVAWVIGRLARWGTSLYYPIRRSRLGGNDVS